MNIGKLEPLHQGKQMTKYQQIDRCLWIRRQGDGALFAACQSFCSEIFGIELDTLTGPPLDHSNPAAYVSAEVELARVIDDFMQTNQTILIPIGDGPAVATMISFMLARCPIGHSSRLCFLANGKDSMSSALALLKMMRQPKNLAVSPTCVAPYLTSGASRIRSVPQDFGFMHILSGIPRGDAYRCVYVLQQFLGAVCHDLKNSLAVKLGKGLPPVPGSNECLGGMEVVALPSLIRNMPVVDEDKAILADFASALEHLVECSENHSVICVNTLKQSPVYRRFKDGMHT